MDDSSETNEPEQRSNGCFFWLVLSGVSYLLSSGPVIALCFWLRESTGWDSFYSVLFFYFPLIVMGHGSFMNHYIEFWVVDVFHTVGPG